ncbi:Phosphoglycerate mutase family protein [Candidatus Rhodobacter oscarellae]|uniref:Phosphoglycerate mutase family protein n=1 Tax=Candidatus Rhodobacter oscarellae TaxID=1675527 RepID=A0A0J9E5C4_9RHOB|nr:histidine phosphatase family protein [Candidatus Rhodobacter lobularis]KMW57975.1 Phosphoglycerate mutase family protein [Candidatus Rhodobacter lobularis]
MTTFWWVRHGPTHEKAFVGWRDVPADLSDRAQIARLSAHLPQDALVISSDLIRCTATADAIQGARARLPDEPELREFNFGDWDGMHFRDVAARFPKLSRAYWEQPGDAAPPNGESWNQAEARIARAVARLAAAHPGRHIIAVAHMGVIVSQIRRALGVTAYQALGHKIDNLSVTRIAGGEADPINHLP